MSSKKELRKAYEILQKEINRVDKKKNVTSAIYTRYLQNIGAYLNLLK